MVLIELTILLFVILINGIQVANKQVPMEMIVASTIGIKGIDANRIVPLAAASTKIMHT